MSSVLSLSSSLIGHFADTPTPTTKGLFVACAIVLVAVLVVVSSSSWRPPPVKQPSSSRARRRPSWLPWGIDRLWLAMRAHRQNKGLELWCSMFQDWAPPGSLTFESRLGGQTVIFTVDPDNLKAVLARQFSDFGKGDRFKHLRPFLGDSSIFINDGEKWSSARQLLRPHLSEDRIGDMRILDRNATSLVLHIQQQQQQQHGCIKDVEAMFLCYTMDVITEFLLGVNPDTLHNPSDRFAAAFHDIQVISGQIARAGPLAFLVPHKKYHAALKVLDEYIEPYVRRAMRLQQSNDNDDDDDEQPEEIKQSFLNTLARSTTNKDASFLRDSIVTVLFAGRDSTASTLTWLLHELSQRPSLWHQARHEVLSVLNTPEKQTTLHDLKRLTFVNACINETLRLYPLVPFNIREALTDTTLPRGGGPSGREPIAVAKGSAVSFSPLFLQRHRAMYEDKLRDDKDWPDPLVFEPARWLRGDVGGGWVPRAWTYIPFNGGQRLCLGQRFAMTEMVHVVAVLLQRYESVERVDGAVMPGLMCNLTVSPSTKIQVRFK